MKHLDLFSGAGLFHVAAKAVWPDIELACFVEKEPFAQIWLRWGELAERGDATPQDITISAMAHRLKLMEGNHRTHNMNKLHI